MHGRPGVYPARAGVTVTKTQSGDGMTDSINRREFMATSAGIAVALGLASPTAGAQAPAPGAQPPPPVSSSLTFKTRPHKALIARPTEDELKRMKDAGFEGVEAR